MLLPSKQWGGRRRDGGRLKQQLLAVLQFPDLPAHPSLTSSSRPSDPSHSRSWSLTEELAVSREGSIHTTFFDSFHGLLP